MKCMIIENKFRYYGGSMETGRANLEGIEFIYARDWKTIFLTPASSLVRIPLELQDKKGFFIILDSMPSCYIAYIISCQSGLNSGLVLTAEYYIKSYKTAVSKGLKVQEIEFVGNEIDAIFDPILYFYRKHKESEQNLGEAVLYNSETSMEHDFYFKGENLKAIVRYGDMLSEGISSDRVLHARLIVKVPETEDLSFVFNVYKLILVFVQMMTYHQKCHFNSIKLFGGTVSGDRVAIGYLFVEKYDEERLLASRNYKLHPYLGKILNMLGSDITYHVEHLPEHQDHFRKFSTLDVLTIFAAFESECEKEKDKYITKTNKFKYINDEVSRLFEILSDKYIDKSEKEYITTIKSRVVDLGKEYGERQKISNAYKLCEGLVASSYIACPDEAEICKVVKELVKIRNSAIHHNAFPYLSETENQYVRWFHILYMAMFLRRAGIPDDIIESTLDDLFMCNAKLED
jgi:hypothetical protein